MQALRGRKGRISATPLLPPARWQKAVVGQRRYPMLAHKNRQWLGALGLFAGFAASIHAGDGPGPKKEVMTAAEARALLARMANDIRASKKPIVVEHAPLPLEVFK
jgi:hypothetical protein